MATLLWFDEGNELYQAYKMRKYKNESWFQGDSLAEVVKREVEFILS